ENAHHPQSAQRRDRRADRDVTQADNNDVENIPTAGEVLARALSQELKHELRSENEKEVHIPLLDQSAVLASFAKMCVPAEDRRVRDDAKQDECVPEPVAREPAKQRNAFAVF